jgi:hypothetical protein
MTMNSDSSPLPQANVEPAPTDHPVARAASPSTHANGVRWGIWQGAIVAAAAAAIVAWLLGELGVAKAVAANEAVPTMGVTIMAPTAATTQAADLKNCIRLFGVFGALLGISLGMAGGRLRGNARTTWWAASVGLIGGGVSGAVVPMFVVPAFHRWQSAGAEDLTYSMAMHAGLLILPGVIAGLALAIGLGNKKRLIHAALGAALGAVIGAVVYDLAGGYAFPFANTGDPLATMSVARLVELIVPAIAIAVGAACGASDGQS